MNLDEIRKQCEEGLKYFVPAYVPTWEMIDFLLKRVEELEKEKENHSCYETELRNGLVSRL